MHFYHTISTSEQNKNLHLGYSLNQICIDIDVNMAYVFVGNIEQQKGI